MMRVAAKTRERSSDLVGALIAAAIGAVVAATGFDLERPVCGDEPFRVFPGRVLPEVDRETVLRGTSPQQTRDPVGFWKARRAYQKSGVIVEDRDFVVRERYWIPESRDVGEVVKVTAGDNWVTCSGLYRSASKWREQALPERPDSRTEKTMTIEVERPGPFEKVRIDTVTTTYHIEGLGVPPERVGVIVEETPEGTLVDTPSHLLRLELPRIRDVVIRGPDWANGYADGGAVGYGENPDSPEQYVGTVVTDRDADGNYDVEWSQTGRTGSYRFDDSRGYYDIVRMAGADGSEAESSDGDDVEGESSPRPADGT